MKMMLLLMLSMIVPMLKMTMVNIMSFYVLI